MTWNDVATNLPEFVQWAVQKYGGLPEGEVTEDDYNRLVTEWMDRPASPSRVKDAEE